MNRDGRSSHPPGAQGETLLVAAAAVAGAVGLALVGGAWLAVTLDGARLHGGISAWLGAVARLRSHPGDPAAAWGHFATHVPGPVLYWACTAVVTATVAGLSWALVRLWRSVGAPPRGERFGVEVDARVATRADVAPLVIRRGPVPAGRFLLGRMAPRGPLLATEDPDRHPAKGRAARLQGARGSVALIGPTRSGKTRLASRGIANWDGPVVAVSVKRDLYDATINAREVRGKVAVFDPGGVTGIPTARWSPLCDITTVSGAMRAARALSSAIPRAGAQTGDFWTKHAESLIGAYFSVVGLSRLLPDVMEGRPPFTMQRLAALAFAQAGITDTDVNELVVAGLHESRPLEVRLLADNAANKLAALQREDQKIRSSIYVTARLALEAWSEPAVAHSATDDPRPTYDAPAPSDQPEPFIDLDWLMGGGDNVANTLYLSASHTEFTRLAPVLGGLLGDLREQIHADDIAGRRLAKPLLIVIDEAGQLELDWLPAEVSTIAGLGAILVTCWQSRAQITHRYGTLADAVLAGHRTKVFFNGIDDPSTLDYVTRIAGTTTVPHRGWNADLATGRRGINETERAENLFPPNLVRQLRRGSAVLIHASVPPIQLASHLTGCT